MNGYQNHERVEGGALDRRSHGVAVAVLAVLAVFGVLGAFGVGAQESGPASLFIDRVDVNVINVEVFVSDQKGQRIHGLTLEDFEILEDGVPVEITNFYTTERQDQAVAGFDRDRLMVEGERESPAGHEVPREVPREQRLSLVVYVDNYNIRPASRSKVLKDLGKFVEDRVAQGDRVSILSHQLTVEQTVPFTEDLVALAQGIEAIAKQSAFRQANDAARRRVLRTIEDSAGARAAEGQDSSNARDAIRNYIQQTQNEVKRSVHALDSVLRSLGGLPGRKALLYVSDGLQQRPGADLFEYYIDRFGSDPGASFAPTTELLNADQSDLFAQVSQQANAGQVTLYTLHAMGASPRSSVSAAEAPAALRNRGNSLADAVALDNLQEPLVDLAATTGGTAILNTSNFAGAFESLSKDFDSLYSLGYASRTGGDGKHHSIEVKLKTPGLKVRHRKGYVDKSQQDRIADRTYSSLILDMESNPLGLTVEFGTPEKTGFKKFHLPLLVKIPFDTITMLPNADQHEGRLRIFLTVQNEDGGVAGLQEIPYPVKIPSGDLQQTQGKEMGYVGKLLLRPGIAKVAIGVWDEISGTESFVHKSVQVGKTKKKPSRG